MSVLSENMKLLRLKSGLTQAQLAEKIGITDKNWSSYERGKTEPPIDTLVKIANVFGLSVDSLIKRDLSLIVNMLIEKSTANEDLSFANEANLHYKTACKNVDEEVVLIPFARLDKLYERISDMETRLNQLEKKRRIKSGK